MGRTEETQQAEAQQAARLARLAAEEFPPEPGGRINLNPGTMARPSRRALAAIAAYPEDGRCSWPLGQYGAGREAIQAARRRAAALWGATPAITAGTTQTVNLILLNLLIQRGRPCRVLTTGHEHEGGIAGFERHPGWSVSYLPDDALTDPALAGEIARRERPDLLFLSHITWTDGRLLPVEEIRMAVAEACPEAWALLDAAQSVGLASLPPGFAERWELTVASAHKWLAAPSGLGLLWRGARARAAGPLCWGGHPLDPEAAEGGDEQAGGQDFSRLCGLAAALDLYAEAGIAAAQAESARKADRLAEGIHAILGGAGRGHAFAVPDQPGAWSGAPVPMAGICTVRLEEDPYPLYRALEEARVHVKCVKGRTPTGVELRQLRLGVPWYTTDAEIGEALERLARCVAALPGAA